MCLPVLLGGTHSGCCCYVQHSSKPAQHVLHAAQYRCVLRLMIHSRRHAKSLAGNTVHPPACACCACRPPPHPHPHPPKIPHRSLAKLSYRPSASSLQQLADASLALLRSASAQDLSLTAYSFAVLGYKPPEGWWVGFWAVSGPKMDQASCQGLANMFWAHGRLRKVGLWLAALGGFCCTVLGCVCECCCLLNS